MTHTRILNISSIASIALAFTLGISSCPAEGVLSAPQVRAQFDDLKHHPATLGFWNNGIADLNLTLSKHWQGIVRSPNPGTPYFFLTKSGASQATLAVLRMGSRDSPDGERIRSNRISMKDTTALTDPPKSDSLVWSQDFGDDGWPAYNHAGGMSIYEDILVIPLEDQYGPFEEENEDSMVVFVDVANPENPILLLGRITHTGKKAGIAAITRHSDGRFLVVVSSDDKKFYTYRSEGTDLRSPALTFGDPVETHFEGDTKMPDGAQAYQTLNFVQSTGVDNKLYALGNRNNTGLPEGGEDELHLWTVSFSDTASGPKIDLTDRQVKHIYCNSDAFGRACNAAAAGGWYVSPSGQLLYYGTEHWDNDDGWTRMAEFHSSKLNYDGKARPWDCYVEMFDDDHGWSGSDRSLILDARDARFARWENLENHENFGDKISSVRWVLASGFRVRLYQHDEYSGSYLDLEGNGRLQQYADLGDVGWTSGSGKVGDQISSVKVISGPVIFWVPEDGNLNEAAEAAGSTGEISILGGEGVSYPVLPGGATIRARISHRGLPVTLGR